MSTSPTGSTSSTGIRLPALPSMRQQCNAYRPSIQLAPLVWKDRRRSSGTVTDGEESSCSEGSVRIERLRLASRAQSVSPVKVLPPINRKLHFPPSSAKRRSHPILETAPRRLVLTPAVPSTAIPQRDSISPPMPSVTLLPHTAGFRPMHTPRLMVPATPRTLKEAQGVGRMVLVNPIIAAHLKRGGVVNVRSTDGTRKFRISLPATATTPVVEAAMSSAQKV